MRLSGIYLLLLCFVYSCGEVSSSAEAKTAELVPVEKVKVQHETLPEVPIVDYNGLAPLLHKDNDTTYVVNFWATWCKPCVAELPYFEQLTETYKGQKVKVLLVSLDFSKQIKSKLLPFVAKRQLKSDVIVLVDNDTNTWIPKVSPDWSGAIPATIVYKGDQRKFYEQSFHSFTEINDIVKTFLN